MSAYSGAAILAILVLHLIWRFRLAVPAGRWHAIAALGLAVMGFGQLALVFQIEPIYQHYTPWMWSGFILLVDGLNCRLTGSSLIFSRKSAFWILLPLSILFWVAFEIYNLRLQNWIYVGLPDNLVHRYLSYGWAFSTILPAVFLASELYYNLCFKDMKPGRPWPIGPALLRASVVVGVAFLVIPPLFPPAVAGYLFGFVWLGVIFAIDPWNYHLGRRSLFADLQKGHWQRIAALWWGGVLCGFLWEFWNYWAYAKWIYIFPIFQQAKIFEMPIPGYLGFPFFVMECFAFCELVMGWRWPGFIKLEKK